MRRIVPLLLLINFLVVIGCANSNQNISNKEKKLEGQVSEKTTPYHKLSYKERLKRDTKGLRYLHWDSLNPEDFNTRPSLYNKLTKDRIKFYNKILQREYSNLTIKELGLFSKAAVCVSSNTDDEYLYFVDSEKLININKTFDSDYQDTTNLIRFDSILNASVYAYNKPLDSTTLKSLNKNIFIEKHDININKKDFKVSKLFITKPKTYATEDLALIKANSIYLNDLIIGGKGSCHIYDSRGNLVCSISEKSVPIMITLFSSDDNYLLNEYFYELGEGCPNCIPHGISVYKLSDCSKVLEFDYPSNSTTGASFMTYSSDSEVKNLLSIYFDIYNSNNGRKTHFVLIDITKPDFGFIKVMDYKYAKSEKFFDWLYNTLNEINNITDLKAFGFSKQNLNVYSN